MGMKRSQRIGKDARVKHVKIQSVGEERETKKGTVTKGIMINHIKSGNVRLNEIEKVMI